MEAGAARPVRRLGAERPELGLARGDAGRPARRGDQDGLAAGEVGALHETQRLARARPRRRAVDEPLGREQVRARPREEAQALEAVGSAAEDVRERRQEVLRPVHDAAGREELHVRERGREERERAARDGVDGDLDLPRARGLGGGLREPPGDRGDVAHRRVEDGEDLERVGRMAAPVAPDQGRSLAAAQRPAERGPGPRVSGGVLQRGEKRPQARGGARFGARVAGAREGAGGFLRLARHEHRQDNGFEATMGP